MPPPLPRRLLGVVAWESRLKTLLPWPKIWAHIYGGLSTNWESDLAWKIANGVVKTRAYLKSWKRLCMDDRCAGCGERKTTLHAFCECNLVSPVWSWMSTLINKLYPNPIILILFRHGLPSCKRFATANELCSVLIKITLNKLWAARNLGTFESRRPVIVSIINIIKARICTRIRAAFHFVPHPDFLKS